MAGILDNPVNAGSWRLLSMKSMDSQCQPVSFQLGCNSWKKQWCHAPAIISHHLEVTTLSGGRDLVAVGQPQRCYSQPAMTTACVGSSGAEGALTHHVLVELWRQWLSQHRLTPKLERGKIVLLTAPCWVRVCVLRGAFLKGPSDLWVHVPWCS